MGLRISEIATLRLDQCQINQRAGSIALVDAKGGKTRTLDLHNMARRALYDYLFPEYSPDRERDRESVYVFISQRAAWLRQQGQPDHLSERSIEHLWMQLKRKGTQEEWQFIAEVTFHDLRHDFAHRACQAGHLKKSPCMLATRRKMARLPLPPPCAIHFPAGRRSKNVYRR